MRFDFDTRKNCSNLERHGISFEEAQELWEGSYVIIPAKNVRGEERFAILGKAKGKVYLGIFTKRGDAIRIISCHRADKKWEEIYYEYIRKG